MKVNEIIKQYLIDHGIKQTFLINEIKKNNTKTTLSKSKLNMSLNSQRKLTADEFMDIILVLKIDANTFINTKKEIEPSDQTDSISNN